MPVALLAQIILACSKPGEIVLDPFAGSGTTLVAAARLGRKWAGVELSTEYAAHAMKRIKEEVLQLPLADLVKDHQLQKGCHGPKALDK
jgi:DNA modification methylase